MFGMKLRTRGKIAVFIFSFLSLALGAEAKVAPAFQVYSKGVDLAGKKKWAEALEKFDATISQNPAFVSAYLEWARAAMMLNRRTEALNKLSAALAFARNEAERKKIVDERNSLSEIFFTNEAFQAYQYGLNFLSLDQVGKAIESLEKAKGLEGDNVLVLTAYAKALKLEEKEAESVEILEKAFALNEGLEPVRINLAESILGKNPQRAQQLLRPLLQGAPEEKVYWLQAQALSSQKRNKDAIEFFRAAVDRNPHWSFAPFWLGKLYSLESNGAWNARKYLMTFLKRTQKSGQGNASETEEGRKLLAARAEAEELLVRVNRALE